MRLPPETIEAAYLAACHAELDALKPGNVHRFAAGHGMTAQCFQDAARASAPLIALRGAGVGQRILSATKASWEAVAMNTNLGILLLCAPMALAAERRCRGQDLRTAVGKVLDDLDEDDAHNVFAAIARASPGGLGEAGEADVRRLPKIGLVEAMRLARERDLIALQYADGYKELFEIGLPALDRAPFAGTETGLNATLACFLAFATRFPDSHVARKHGSERAEELRRRIGDFEHRLNGSRDPASAALLARSFDAELKRDGLNPGTCADLTVASLFARNLAEAAEG